MNFDDVSCNHVSYGDVSHDNFSHYEASHDANEAFSHTSAASFPHDPNIHRDSVMNLTGVPDDPKVGRLLVRGDKKEV